MGSLSLVPREREFGIYALGAAAEKRVGGYLLRMIASRTGFNIRDLCSCSVD